MSLPYRRGARPSLTWVGLFCLLGPAAGCELVDSHRPIEIVLPPLPTIYASVLPEPAYRIDWIDLDGDIRWAVATPGTSSVVASLPKSAGTAVVAYPLVPDIPDVLRPAGGVFPDSLNQTGRLILSWRDGFLAQRLFRIAALGVPVETVNIPKLQARIERVAGDNPWTLDSVELEVALSRGNLTAAAVKRRAEHDIVLPVDSGTWILDSFAAPPVFGIEPSTQIRATEGHHALVNVFSHEVVSFSVDEGGRAAILIRSPD